MRRVLLKSDKDEKTGQFKKGNPGGGRPFGSIPKVTVKLKTALVEAAALVGCDELGTGGLHGYLYKLAIDHPAVFARLLERVLPLTLTGEIEHTAKKYETMEELAEALKARGLPPPQKIIDVTPHVVVTSKQRSA